MSIFLNANEIRDLTGYKRPSDQQRWLLQRGWLHEVNAVGVPVILRRYAEDKLSGIKPGSHNKKPPAPDFSRING